MCLAHRQSRTWALEGEGSRLYGSRWTPRGVPADFASATLSLAALERFVHTDPDLEPADLVAVEIEITPEHRYRFRCRLGPPVQLA